MAEIIIVHIPFRVQSIWEFYFVGEKHAAKFGAHSAKVYCPQITDHAMLKFLLMLSTKINRFACPLNSSTKIRKLIASPLQYVVQKEHQQRRGIRLCIKWGVTSHISDECSLNFVVRYWGPNSVRDKIIHRQESSSHLLQQLVQRLAGFFCILIFCSFLRTLNILVLKRTSFSTAHYLLISLFLFGSLSCKEEILSGKAVKISDGDTFTILTSDKKQIKIRLYGVDAPEKGQDFGNVAKEYLGKLLRDQVVTIKSKGRDKYGRTIGIATVDSKNVNEELLKAGLVWHFRRYDKNSDWNLLEIQARQHKKGLWSQPNPVAPWDFRKSKKQKKL